MNFQEAALLIVSVGAYPTYRIARYLKARYGGAGNRLDPRGSKELQDRETAWRSSVEEHSANARAAVAGKGSSPAI